MVSSARKHLAGDTRAVLPKMRKTLCGRWMLIDRIMSESTWAMLQPAARCRHCEKVHAGRQAARAMGIKDAVRALSTPSRPDGDPPKCLSPYDY